MFFIPSEDEDEEGHMGLIGSAAFRDLQLSELMGQPDQFVGWLSCYLAALGCCFWLLIPLFPTC